MRLTPGTRIYVAVLAIAALLAGACGSRNPQQQSGAAAAGPALSQPAQGASQPEQATASPDQGTTSGNAAAGQPVGSGGAASSQPATAAASGAPAGTKRASTAAAQANGPAGGVTGSAATPAGGGTTKSESGGGSAAAATAPPAASGGAKPSSGAITIPGPSSQGVTDTDIKVGVLAPLSGYAGFLGQAEADGAKALLSDVNAKGGVNGRKYQIVVADSRWEPATAAIAIRRLVEQEKVFALLVDMAAESIYQYVASKGIPTAAVGVLPPAYSPRFPNVYPVALGTVDTVVHQAYTLTQVLKLPIKTVGIVYESANLPWEGYQDYAKRAWEHFGVQVKSVDRFNLSDGDCTQLVLKMQNLNVDYWQVAQTLGLPLCVQAMGRQNWKPKFGFGGPYTDTVEWANQSGPYWDGIWAATIRPQIRVSKGQPYPFDGDPNGKAPELDHFIDSLQKYSPRTANYAGESNIWTHIAWSMAKLLDDSVKAQSGSLTWKGVNQWIQGQTHWKSGLVSPINFSPNCKSGAPPYMFKFEWNQAGQSNQETDWHPYGGYQDVPVDVKNAIVPGAGDCYLAAMADKKL